MGRRAWLFAGSQLAGQRAAVVMSLVQSAKLNGHDPWAYLNDGRSASLQLAPCALTEPTTSESIAVKGGTAGRLRPIEFLHDWGVATTD